MKAENVFGESYGKSSVQSSKGEIVRGFDQSPSDKFKSVAQASYLNQREVYQKQRAVANSSQMSASAYTPHQVSEFNLIDNRTSQAMLPLDSSASPLTNKNILPSKRPSALQLFLSIIQRRPHRLNIIIRDPLANSTIKHSLYHFKK